MWVVFFFLLHILGGMYDPHKRSITNNYNNEKIPPHSSELVLRLPQHRWEKWPQAWWGTSPRDAGRASCWVHMARSLAASRKSINLPGPRIHESGNKMVTSK